MKLLVTGGSGFIGSHLIDYLSQQGNEVINFDIRPPSYKQSAYYYKGNILNENELKHAFQGVDMVFHLAAEAKVNQYYNNPVISSETNILGTIKVLEAARHNKIKRVLFASSEWVYSGVQTKEPVDEETKIYPPSPPHLYSASKISGELACITYKSLYDLNYTIMRFGIPFGERAWSETVTPIFLKKIFTGEPLTIRGKGDQFRQFVYVKDLVKGIYALTKNEAENQIFNLNGKKAITVMDIVHTIEEITGIKATLQSIPERPGDFKGYYVSSRKAKELVGWEPLTDYKDAMKNYISWFKKYELKLENL